MQAPSAYMHIEIADICGSGAHHASGDRGDWDIVSFAHNAFIASSVWQSAITRHDTRSETRFLSGSCRKRPPEFLTFSGRLLSYPWCVHCRPYLACFAGEYCRLAVRTAVKRANLVAMQTLQLMSV